MQPKLDPCGASFTREIPSTIRYVISPLERHERLLTEAGLHRFDADAAVRLLIEASQSALEGGDVEAGLRAARRAVALAIEADGTTLALARIALAAPLMLSGDAAEASALLEGWLNEPPLDELFDGAFRAATLLFWLERYDAAAELLERLVAVARESGRLDRLARPLDTLASLDYRLGRWRRAEARSREALRVARLGAQPFEIGSALTTQARVSAARGDDDACRALLDAARTAAPDDALVAGYAATAEALLHLSCDRPEAAIALLEPLAATPLARHEPTVFLWEPDLIEAYVRAGRRDDAQLLLVDFESRAASTRPPLGARRSRSLPGPPCACRRSRPALRRRARLSPGTTHAVRAAPARSSPTAPASGVATAWEMRECTCGRPSPRSSCCRRMPGSSGRDASSIRPGGSRIRHPARRRD